MPKLSRGCHKINISQLRLPAAGRDAEFSMVNGASCKPTSFDRLRVCDNSRPTVLGAGRPTARGWIYISL